MDRGRKSTYALWAIVLLVALIGVRVFRAHLVKEIARDRGQAGVRGR